MMQLMLGPRYCFECKAVNPLWFSNHFGIYLCDQCASIHRGLTSIDSQVISLTHERLDHDDLVGFSFKKLR